MTRLAPLLLATLACVAPFDPTVWRVETVTVCDFTLAGRPSCRTMRCEVRGPRAALQPGEGARVVMDLEIRNCQVAA